MKKKFQLFLKTLSFKFCDKGLGLGDVTVLAIKGCGLGFAVRICKPHGFVGFYVIERRIKCQDGSTVMTPWWSSNEFVLVSKWQYGLDHSWEASLRS